VDGFRYGAVGIQADEAMPFIESDRSVEDDSGPTALDFLDEAGAFDWVLGEVRSGRELQMLEVELVVKALGAAMRGAVDFLIPVLRLEEYDKYTTVHSLNVSILAMAFGEFLGLDRDQIQILGIGGVLHDLGKIKVPPAVLEKETDLSPEEWKLIRQHPVDGARIILESDERLELPAIMAYEHHMCFAGGGYPVPARKRSCHPLSHLLQLCDVYDTLAAPRPYRGPLPRAKILSAIEEGAGTIFDPHLARGFRRMMGEWDGKIQVFESDGEPEEVAESVP
ncbi:MAG: HD-GYP domain-containing protein, partial [Longimicrobiales bacterium]